MDVTAIVVATAGLFAWGLIAELFGEFAAAAGPEPGGPVEVTPPRNRLSR